MWNILRPSTLLFRILLLSLSKVGANPHIHEVRHSDNYLSALEQTESASGIYGSANGDGKDVEVMWKKSHEGDGTMRNGRETETVTIEVGEFDKHIGGEQLKTTIFETASAEALEMGYEHRTEVQMSFITMTVFETGPGTTVTVTPEVQVMTEMVTVTAPGTTITAPGTTITEAGICSQTGLANIFPSQTLFSETSSSTAVTASSMGSPVQATTGVAPMSIGSSGQIAGGTGTLNAAGYCDCQCLCNADSFPTVTYASMGYAPVATLTTLQTLASSTAALSMVSASIVSSMAASEAISFLSSSADAGAIAATTTMSGITSITSSSSSTSSIPSSISIASSSSTSSISSMTAAVTSSSAAVTVPPSQSTVPAQGPNVPFNISTLSLSSALILGSLGAHATPAP